MRLRKLELRDAYMMLEWMHDDSVVHYLNSNFCSKTINDCIKFIESTQDSDKDLHLAIVDEHDEYMGTVSLKHIDSDNKNAEFAVTVRKVAMGKGYSAYGMAEILKYGKEKLELEKIYWCVLEDNVRAVKFYDKNLYKRTNQVPISLKNYYSKEQNDKFIWYVYEG